MAYEVCSSCMRHIRSDERICPFCGVAHLAKPATTRAPLARMSRARWLAFGSTIAVVACSETLPPTLESHEDAGQTRDATASDVTASDSDAADDVSRTADAAGDVRGSSVDAAGDVSRPDADAGQPVNDAGPFEDASEGASWVDASSCATGRGTFSCVLGQECQPCQRGSQYCAAVYCYGQNPCGYGCYSNADDAGAIDFPRQCQASPTCACLWDAGSLYYPCRCTDGDDAGVAMVVTCGSCYGSPPARLERAGA
jgi:hypothetical protein